MVISRVELQDDVPTGRVRVAAEGRETAHLRCPFSFVLQHALFQRARHSLCRQGVGCMEAPHPAMEPETAEAPLGLTYQRRARDSDEDIVVGEPPT